MALGRGKHISLATGHRPMPRPPGIYRCLITRHRASTDARHQAPGFGASKRGSAIIMIETTALMPPSHNTLFLEPRESALIIFSIVKLLKWQVVGSDKHYCFQRPAGWYTQKGICVALCGDSSIGRVVPARDVFFFSLCFFRSSMETEKKDCQCRLLALTSKQQTLCRFKHVDTFSGMGYC